MKEALDIRLEVFVAEQGVPLELEIDEHDRDDPSAVHVLARLDGRAIGTGRYYVLQAGHAQIGRMAVMPAFRNRGAATVILGALVAAARKAGFSEVHLHAQVHAAGFYRKAGFAEYGEPFDDAGIAHIAMAMSLV